MSKINKKILINIIKTSTFNIFKAIQNSRYNVGKLFSDPIFKKILLSRIFYMELELGIVLKKNALP